MTWTLRVIAILLGLAGAYSMYEGSKGVTIAAFVLAGVLFIASIFVSGKKEEAIKLT